MNDFTVIPAIDLIEGECVRLYQGDYNQKTVYSKNPVDMAMGFEKEGAKVLHIVDLDGAKAGHPVNVAVIKDIVSAVSMDIEVGGGIRTKDDIATLLDAGVEHVILGTSVIKDPIFAKKALQEFGEHIIIGLDARDGNVAVDGWTNTTSVSALTVAQTMEKYGATRIIYTDISKDGTLEGPNLTALTNLAKKVSIEVIASGGIGKIEHIKSIRSLGLDNIKGCIIGKSLYTGAFTLKDALSSAS